MTSADLSPFPLLQTKLYPPRVPETMVRRRVLIERLNRRPRAITLVSAPAGYGKSLLVTQWMDAGDEAYVWLSLDEYDTRPEMVIAYVVAAFARRFPTMRFESAGLLSHTQIPAPEQLADGLLRDLDALPEPVSLILDDYHAIENKDIHRIIERILRQLPPRLRLALITRSDPPLSLDRLRAGGRLQEVRAADLRFSGAETRELLRQIVPGAVDEQTVTLLNEETEGWPVGLRLAAISYREAADKAQFLERFGAGGQKNVSDYLLGEVLGSLPNNQRLLLLRTAVVDRFCAPLIDRLNQQILPGIGGYELLDMLWGANLFLIALDVQGAWYRYHHLFRRLLQQQLRRVYSAEAIAEMHQLAASWFAEEGFVEDAIIHALHAGDSVRAAELVEAHVHGAVNAENWRLLDSWIRLLPQEVLGRPGVLAAQVMLAQISYRLGAMPALLDAAERGLQAGEGGYTAAQAISWMGVINAFRATLFLEASTPQATLRYAQTALRQLDEGAGYVRGLAWLWYIYALQHMGEVEEAKRVARREIQKLTGPPDTRLFRLMLAQCAIYYGEADAHALRKPADAYHEMALRTGHLMSRGWAGFLQGWCAYQAHDLDQAHACFAGAVALRHVIHARAAVDSFSGLALIAARRGDRAGLRETLRMLDDFILEQGLVGMLPAAESLAMRLAPGRSPASAPAEFRRHLQAQLAADMWELPALTACRLDIRSGDTERLERARETLAECEAYARARGAKRLLLQTGVLKTLLYDARAAHDRALDSLRSTLALVEAGGALQYIADGGQALAPYLVALRDEGTAVSTVTAVLAILRGVPVPGAEGRGLSPAAVTLIGELTAREMEVLTLLGELLTNKEIAARLHISPRTVKKHSINLYRKLDVDGRRPAVARARELGIL